jgi:hypothetical protein
MSNHASPPAQTLSPQDAALAQALAALGPPGFTPPSLLNPNYVPPDRGPQVIAVTITFTIVAVIIVALRLYLRVFHRDQKVKWDDYLIVPAIVRSWPRENPKGPFLLLTLLRCA